MDILLEGLYRAQALDDAIGDGGFRRPAAVTVSAREGLRRGYRPALAARARRLGAEWVREALRTDEWRLRN
jgi:hypothetical protein